MPPKTPTGFPTRWRKSAAVLALACLVAAAMLIARQPSPAGNEPRVETSIVEVQPQEPTAVQPAPKPRAARADAAPKPRASNAPGANRTPATTVTAATTTPKASASPAANAPVAEPAPKPAAVERNPSRAEANSAATAQASDVVTITGCLDLDDDKFRLTDTSGDNAPRARSWRSGFIRRSRVRIEVIDAADRLRLPSHVGHRVSITGTLVDREMQARSVKMVAASCDD